MNHHPDGNANIIHSKTSENSIVKIQTGGELLSAEEKEILAFFTRNYRRGSGGSNRHGLRGRLAGSEKLSEISQFELDTSERSFSRVRLILNFNRSRMTPARVEAVLVLFPNYEFWDLNLVKSVVNKVS